MILGTNDAPMMRPPILDDLDITTVHPNIDYRRMFGRELRHSPLLLVYDVERVLHAVIQAPLTMESADALARWIAGGPT